MTKILSPAARAMGRRGGRVRAERLSPQDRSRIARTAACARWEARRNVASIIRNFEILGLQRELRDASRG